MQKLIQEAQAQDLDIFVGVSDSIYDFIKGGALVETELFSQCFKQVVGCLSYDGTVIDSVLEWTEINCDDQFLLNRCLLQTDLYKLLNLILNTYLKCVIKYNLVQGLKSVSLDGKVIMLDK